MKKILLILKQNVLGFKVEIVIFLLIIALIIPIYLLNFSDERSSDSLEIDRLQVKIQSYDINFANDIYLKYDLNEKIKEICTQNDYDCFMTVWVYEPLLQEYQLLGPVTEITSENTETLIPTTLLSQYGFLDDESIKVKLKIDVIQGEKTFVVESNEMIVTNNQD